MALIASVVKQGSGASSAINTSNAKLLIVLDGGFTANIPTDSKANSFTSLTHTASAVRPDLFLGYKINPTVGTGHTVSANGSSNDTIIMLAFDDNVSAIDVTTIGEQTYAGHTTTTTTSSITTTQNLDLLVAIFTVDDPAGGPFSYTAGFTVGPFGDDSPGTFFGASVAYGIQSTAGAITCTRTRTVAATQTGESFALLAFKVTAATVPPWNPYQNQPNLAPLLAQRRRSVGWSPNQDHRWRRHKGGLIMPRRGLILPRKAA